MRRWSRDCCEISSSSRSICRFTDIAESGFLISWARPLARVPRNARRERMPLCSPGGMARIVDCRIAAMKTEIVQVRDVEADRAVVTATVERLRRGEVVALPTETVYGLAAVPTAEATLREAKG